MAQTDVRELPRIDQAFLGLGVLVLIASFLPWYGASYSTSVLGRGISASSSENAWHGWAALGLILMLLATAIVAVQLMTDTALPTLMVSWNVVVLAIDAIGALILIIRSFTMESADVSGLSIGLRWGAWILMIVALAQVVVGAMRFRASGEAMPWAAHGTDASPEPPTV
jgi:hypothetical protein